MLDLAKKIDEILPQTQCTRCGYPSCFDYANAIAGNQAEINQCPPGGDAGIAKLAEITGKAILPLNPDNGVIKDKTLVVIDEDACIGCTLCIKACPVDAIIGSNKMLHTVIATECTGCDLCIPACPVDCIEIIMDEDKNWSYQRAVKAKMRYENRKFRLERDKKERENRLRSGNNLLDNSQAVGINEKSQIKGILSEILSDLEKSQS